jgi:hypothetical protein
MRQGGHYARNTRTPPGGRAENKQAHVCLVAIEGRGLPPWAITGMVGRLFERGLISTTKQS